MLQSAGGLAAAAAGRRHACSKAWQRGSVCSHPPGNPGGRCLGRQGRRPSQVWAPCGDAASTAPAAAATASWDLPKVARVPNARNACRPARSPCLPAEPQHAIMGSLVGRTGGAHSFVTAQSHCRIAASTPRAVSAVFHSPSAALRPPGPPAACSQLTNGLFLRQASRQAQTSVPRAPAAAATASWCRRRPLRACGRRCVCACRAPAAAAPSLQPPWATQSTWPACGWRSASPRCPAAIERCPRRCSWSGMAGVPKELGGHVWWLASWTHPRATGCPLLTAHPLVAARRLPRRAPSTLHALFITAATAHLFLLSSVFSKDHVRAAEAPAVL